jgi:hypothetical protein
MMQQPIDLDLAAPASADVAVRTLFRGYTAWGGGVGTTPARRSAPCSIFDFADETSVGG